MSLEEDNHKTRLKHVEIKFLIRLVGGCSMDSWIYRAGVEVRKIIYVNRPLIKYSVCWLALLEV